MSGFLSRLLRGRDESGFILPVTLIVIFLLSAFVLHEIKMYETEKQFSGAREEMFVLSRLMQMAVADVEEQLPKKGRGTFRYVNGKVGYSVAAPANQIVVITLKAETDNGGVHVSRLFYDKIKQKIVRWEEDL